jgi:1-acyl-sn-glycerol-3-phosphate acyltransferase
MRFIYSTAYYVFFFASSLVFFPGALLVYLVTLPFDHDGRALHRYTCFWAQTYLRVNPLWRLTIEGRELLPSHGAAIIVANHCSMFDIPAIYSLHRPFKFVAKASLLMVPLVGWNIALNRTVMLKRGDRQSIGKMMERCERWLDRGVPVMLFPEGTRSGSGELLPFKDGAFRLAVKKGVPVIPVVICGTDDILPKHGYRLSLSARCRLKVLTPVSPDSCGGDVVTLRDKVRALIGEERTRLADSLPGASGT